MNFEPLGFVLERVYDLLKHEASILLVDEKELLQSLVEELELIESYLKDMDEVRRKAKLSNVLKAKTNHLMNMALEIEDFLDDLIHQKAQQVQRSRRNRVKAFFSRTSNPITQKHHLAEKVKQIRENLRDTLERHRGLELPSNFPQVTTRSRIPSDSFILKDEIIVGLEEDVDNLVAKFVGKDGGCVSHSAIVGVGGSGKTTLAKKFYNHEEIKEAFPRRAWVCVSQQWDARDLLIKICKMLGVWVSESEKMPQVKLQKFIKEEGTSCLVVLDDVWEKHALEELLPTLLSGNGRVLITTRKEKIVKFSRIGSSYIHRARRLTPKQSWDLFSRIVHNICDGDINLEKVDDYARIGRMMLEKCGGLPLAVITLAGLLGTKGTIQQWESTKDCVISTIMRDDDEAVVKVLELSYFDLPYYIKPCFLYLGTFKEDASIEVRELINLWVDEGFIKVDQCRENRRLEEVAMDFLEELVQRCMIQVGHRGFAEDLQSVQIHDLMRDLCIDKAKELNMFQAVSSSTVPAEIKPPYHRCYHP